MLRFSKDMIFVNEIAAQYYCEKKVEMKYLHGRVETEAKDRGTAAHEKLVEQSEKISAEQIWTKIHAEEPVIIQEMQLYAEYSGLRILGRPDCILFDKSDPLLVLEFKFSNATKPFRDHHIQAETYCLLLEMMGLNVNNLHYAIVMAGPEARNNPNLTNRVIDEILDKESAEPVIHTENVLVYLNKYDPDLIKSELNWATQYWRKEREAIPTRNPNKCRICEYNNNCENSLHTEK